MQTRVTQNHRLTIQEALQAFTERKLTTPPYRPATHDTYLRSLRGFVAFCSDVDYADELSVANVQRYDAELQRRKQGTGSRHTKIAAVKTFLTYLEEEGALSAPFAQDIAVPKQADAKPGRPVDVDEAAVLLHAAEDGGQARDVALVRVLLQTGISLSEAIELTVADLILAPTLSSLSGSGNGVTPTKFSTKPSTSVLSMSCRLRLRRQPMARNQEAPLDDATWQALNAYLAIRPNSSYPQIFLTDGGTPLSQPTASFIVKKYARAAGMPWIHARALRTGYIMRQLAAGIPIAEVQSRLGHRTLATTRRYLGLVDSAAHVSAASRRNCGILLVDERQSTRTQLRLLLEAAGHHVFEAPDGVTALDMLRLSRLALVVLVNVWMRPQSAVDLVQEMKNHHHLLADHRTILIGLQSTAILSQLLNGIATSHVPTISRPIDFESLYAHIAQAYTELGAHGEPLEG